MVSAGAGSAGAGCTTVVSPVVLFSVLLELHAYMANIPAAKRIVNSFFMACFFILHKCKTRREQPIKPYDN
jgi:hypothetical protein